MDSVAAAAAHSFSTMFPMMPGDELGHNLILRALENIDTSAMSRGAASEFIDWLNYNSPLSPMNIDQTLASFNHPQRPNNHPQYQNFAQPHFDSFMQPSSFMQPPNFYMPQEQLDYGYVPTYYPMQQYAYVPSTPVVYQAPVGYVDETAIIYVPDHDQTSNGYEDLLELQEQIGHVNVGLSEQTISNNLKTSRIPAVRNVKNQEEGEVCAVCQDDYKVNDTIGSLECGHRYHANCIKQWLLHKNVCPICKATALVL